MSRADGHARYREALARRLDEQLAPAEGAELEAHLAGCGPCRGVAQAYATERGLLRGLRASDPPRDLWARTSTALDHEVMHAPARPRLIALGSLASLGLVLAVAAGGVGLGPFGQGRPGSATPIPVTPQPIAFVTSQGNQITIYQTQFDEVCPASVAECGGPDPTARPVIIVDLAAAFAPHDLSLGANGNLAITAWDEHGNAVYSVLALPGQGIHGASAPPSATDARGTARASASVPPSKGTRTPAPTSHRPATSAPSTGGTGALGSPVPTGASPGDVQLVPILSDVITAGAPAAWSPDGSTLAFSARPAAGGAGPDVFVWRQGDVTVHALTRDHRSYFASWAGDRIVISRIPEQALIRAAASSGRPGHATPTPTATAAPEPLAVVATTYLLDPTTGATTAVPLADAWLPSVDPTGHRVIFWQGTLLADGPVVQRAAGALYVADWATLTGIPPAVPQASAGPTATPDGSSGSPVGASPGAATTRGPSPPTGTAGTPASPSLGAPAVERTPPLTGSGGTHGPHGAPSASPSASPATSAPPGGTGAAVTPRLLVAAGTHVTDWLVRWTPDGLAYGVWTATASGGAVGLLLVANAERVATADPLSPTPALRAFSLGAGRVTWIAPDAAGQGGDLRIVTWGADGAGGAHIPVSTGATLAF